VFLYLDPERVQRHGNAATARHAVTERIVTSQFLHHENTTTIIRNVNKQDAPKPVGAAIVLQPTAPPDRLAGALGHDHRYVARLSGRAAACLQPRDSSDGRVYTFNRPM